MLTCCCAAGPWEADVNDENPAQVDEHEDAQHGHQKYEGKDPAGGWLQNILGTVPLSVAQYLI